VRGNFLFVKIYIFIFLQRERERWDEVGKRYFCKRKVCERHIDIFRTNKCTYQERERERVRESQSEKEGESDSKKEILLP
jgi:hypothetical protein